MVHVFCDICMCKHQHFIQSQIWYEIEERACIKSNRDFVPLLDWKKWHRALEKPTNNNSKKTGYWTPILSEILFVKGCNSICMLLIWSIWQSSHIRGSTTVDDGLAMTPSTSISFMTQVSWCLSGGPSLMGLSLLWRHNGPDGVSNHQLYNCLLSRVFRRR